MALHNLALASGVGATASVGGSTASVTGGGFALAASGVAGCLTGLGVVVIAGVLYYYYIERPHKYKQ